MDKAQNASSRRSAALLAVGMGFLVFGPAQAQTEAEIFEALKPKPITRSLSLGAPSGPASTAAARDETAFIESLKTRKTRSLSTGEREKIAAIAQTKPTIDLEIPFDFNSAEIGPKALPMVKSLGAALARPELKGSTFLLVGHTDAKGSDRINQMLSERRAEAVKRYLVENYQLPADNLVASGFGPTRLKNTADPYASENRRVQAANMSETKSASVR